MRRICSSSWCQIVIHDDDSSSGHVKPPAWVSVSGATPKLDHAAPGRPDSLCHEPSPIAHPATNAQPPSLGRSAAGGGRSGSCHRGERDRLRSSEPRPAMPSDVDRSPRRRGAPTRAARRARRQAAARRPWPASSHPHAGQLLASAADTTWECHAACASSEPGHRSRACQSACGILRCSAASRSDGQGISLPERADARAPRARCEHATPMAGSAPRVGLLLHRSKQ